MIALETDISKAKLPRKVLPTCITSFNEAGYERYGRKFIDTWLEYWPPSIHLIVYYEGEKFDFTKGMSWRPIEEVEFLMDFMSSLQFPIQHGIVGSQYDIWFDARMARKTFMQVHTMRKLGGKVFWIDADSVSTNHVPEGFLDECLPEEALACYLGRDGWYHTESGFIGFNSNHPKAREFMKNYVHTFISGTFHANFMFNRPCWHDCGAFDAIRHVMGNGEEFVNLAKDIPQGHMHPLQLSAPGKYLNHLKGDRKDTGKLRKEDLVH